MVVLKSNNCRPGRYVAIDCEMVGVGPNGTEDLLARVSVVNYFGHVLLDAFIAPSQRVTDWRTKYSGIRPADVLNESGTLSYPASLSPTSVFPPPSKCAQCAHTV